MLSAFDIAKKFITSKSKPFATDIFLKWEEVVGENYAKITKPYKITQVAQQKILVIQTPPGYGLIVQHESLEILKKANRYLKQKYFYQIKVIQSFD